MRDGASHAPYVPFQTSIEREDTQETAMTRPFEGIRVIDVTHVLAGPLATYQLAVLGADVIKVEHPDEPDQSRANGTDKALNRRDMGTSFLTQASNKRAITLDLKTPGDRDILKKLVATADIFVENYRPGAFGPWVLATRRFPRSIRT
jgi:crotonobetainyl-CoA:carnitine CoA-transferase CaiB-like acyl-CoA transferase